MSLATREVWNAYNRALISGGLKPLPPYWYGRLRNHFAELGDFCESKGIDPERWVRAKHEAIGWRFRVKVTQLSNASEAFLGNYLAWGSNVQAEAQSQEEIAASVVLDGPGADGLTILGEAVKRRFAASPEVCLVSEDLTRGWHAQSSWCQSCPLAMQCRGDAGVGR